jgi:RNA polymerase sigma-70 factor (ECF subfamily)
MVVAHAMDQIHVKSVPCQPGRDALERIHKASKPSGGFAIGIRAIILNPLDLLLELRAGDHANYFCSMKLVQDEFDRLALEHLDMLYRIARRLTRDATRAEDLVQETYVRAFRARDDFELQEYGIRPWLVRIMHNLHFSRSQREKRQPAALEDQQLDAATAEPSPAPWAGKASFEGMDQRLVGAIQDLPEEYQTVILLWAVEDFSYKEIADAINVPIGTVMSRLHRARGKLAEKLQDFAREQRIIRE